MREHGIHGGHLGIVELFSQPRLGTLARLFRFYFVNVSVLDCHVGQNRDAFTGDFRKTVAHGEKEILDGKHDDVNEMNFYMKGGIEEIQESGGEAKKDDAKKGSEAKKPEDAKKPEEKKA